MVSPYGAAEKQLLLEAPSLEDRAETLIALAEVEMARSGTGVAAAMSGRRTRRRATRSIAEDARNAGLPADQDAAVASADHTELISVVARLAFPIRDGVPMLSLDEAREIDPAELERRMPELGGLTRVPP